MSQFKYSIAIVVLLLLGIFPIWGQGDIMPAMSNSDYGMVRTNLTFGYEHAFGSVPDNFTGKVSYQAVNKPFLSLSVNARFNTLWSNFYDSQLTLPKKPVWTSGEAPDAWRIGLNGNHSYGAFGFTALGFLPVFHHPLAILAIGNAEWSNHCFGRISGLFGAVYIIKNNPTTQFGVGAVWILHTSSRFPVLPGIVYRHKISDKLLFSLYGSIIGLQFKPDEKNFFELGGDLDVKSFYFKPEIEGWPETCRFTMTSFRPALKYRRQLAPNFYGEAMAGVAFKVSGHITSATHSRSYLDFHEHPSFFLKAQLSYSL